MKNRCKYRVTAVVSLTTSPVFDECLFFTDERHASMPGVASNRMQMRRQLLLSGWNTQSRHTVPLPIMVPLLVMLKH